MTDRRRRSRTAPAPSHDVHRPNLDRHLTIAHSSIATGFGVCNVPFDSGATQKQASTGKVACLGAVDTDIASNLNSSALALRVAGHSPWGSLTCHEHHSRQQ